MNKMMTLDAFWNGFNVPAFDENSVPDEKDRIALSGKAFPYITYEVTSDEFGNKLAQTASLWYRSSSWAGATKKEQEIADYIGRGGRLVKYDGGAIWVCKGSPWAQRMDDSSDELIKRIILNVEIEFLD